MLQTLDRIVRRLFLRNLHLKVIALLLTLALYLWVSVDREVERTRYAPLRVGTPAEMVLVNDPPERIGVTIRGKWSDLAQLESSELDSVRIQVDPSMGRTGHVTLTPDMVDLPPGLRALDIEPNMVQFRLEKKERKTVPIRPRIVGQPAEGYELEGVNHDPRRVEVTGPAHSLEKLMSVSTEPIDLSGQTESFERKVRPRLDDPLVEYRLDEPITVSVQMDAQEVEKQFQGVEVVPHHVNGAMVTSIEPTDVDVVVRGPKAIIDQLDKADLLASVDLSDAPKTRSTTLLKDVKIHNVPEEVEIMRTQPRTFRVRIRPADPLPQARD